MNLTMLGTSHGVPSAQRYTSGYMLEVGENIYIFDAGAPVMDMLLRKGKDLTKVKALFNTHGHGDHIHGGISLITLFTWYFRDTRMEVCLPDKITADAISNYLKAIDNVTVPNDRITFNIYKPGVIFDDGVVKVTAIETRHFHDEEKKSNAFLIEAEGKSILYTGDMACDEVTDDFPAVAYEQFIDIIMTECVHFSPEKLRKVMDKVNTDIFAVIHCSETMYDLVDTLNEEYPYEVILGEDDDEIEL